jgi:hypothetical protein
LNPILDKLKSKVIGFGPSGINLPLPKSAKGDLKKIRFDGSSLVDISLLPQLYVTYKNGIFELHARNIKDSQLVIMTYFDRKNLTIDNGTIRLKTAQELIDEEVNRRIQQIKSKVKYDLERKMGNIIEFSIFTHKLLYVFVKGFRTQNQQILDFIDNYLSVMDQALDISDPAFRDGLIEDYQKFKEIVKNYLDSLKDAGG